MGPPQLRPPPPAAEAVSAERPRLRRPGEARRPPRQAPEADGWQRAADEESWSDPGNEPLGSRLLEAASRGDVGEMDRLLALGADVNYSDPSRSGATAWQLAWVAGHDEVLERLRLEPTLRWDPSEAGPGEAPAAEAEEQQPLDPLESEEEPLPEAPGTVEQELPSDEEMDVLRFLEEPADEAPSAEADAATFEVEASEEPGDDDEPLGVRAEEEAADDGPAGGVARLRPAGSVARFLATKLRPPPQAPPPPPGPPWKRPRLGRLPLQAAEPLLHPARSSSDGRGTRGSGGDAIWGRQPAQAQSPPPPPPAPAASLWDPMPLRPKAKPLRPTTPPKAPAAAPKARPILKAGPLAEAKQASGHEAAWWEWLVGTVWADTKPPPYRKTYRIVRSTLPRMCLEAQHQDGKTRRPRVQGLSECGTGLRWATDQKCFDMPRASSDTRQLIWKELLTGKSAWTWNFVSTPDTGERRADHPSDRGGAAERVRTPPRGAERAQTSTPSRRAQKSKPHAVPPFRGLHLVGPPALAGPMLDADALSLASARQPIHLVTLGLRHVKDDFLSDFDVAYDLRMLHDPEAGELRDHDGHHPEIIARVVENPLFSEFLANARCDVERLLALAEGTAAGSARLRTPPRPLRVALCCNAGRHRSVACGWLLSEVMQLVGFSRVDLRHESLRKCTCEDCGNSAEASDFLKMCVETAQEQWEASSDPRLARDE